MHDLLDGADHYVQHLLGTVPHQLDGIKVVVDCANGAASEVGPGVLPRAGAEVIAIHAEPDGLNINDGCGSTHLDALREAVVEHGADLGIAHDGDADRCLAVDRRRRGGRRRPDHGDPRAGHAGAGHAQPGTPWSPP